MYSIYCMLNNLHIPWWVEILVPSTSCAKWYQLLGVTLKPSQKQITSLLPTINEIVHLINVICMWVSTCLYLKKVAKIVKFKNIWNLFYMLLIISYYVQIKCSCLSGFWEQYKFQTTTGRDPDHVTYLNWGFLGLSSYKWEYALFISISI